MYDQNSYPNDYQNHNNTNTGYTSANTGYSSYQNTNTGSYQYGNTYPNDYSHMNQKKPKEKKTNGGSGYFKKALAAVSLGLLFGLFAGLGLFVVETVTGTSDSADAQAIEGTAEPQVKETLADAETSGQNGGMDTAQEKAPTVQQTETANMEVYRDNVLFRTIYYQ